MKETFCRCRCRLPEKEEWQEELQKLGCSDALIEQFLMRMNDGCSCAAGRILSQHKQMLLQQLHETQDKIEHLDYLLYALQQKKPS